jgi:hypothetical protein
MCLLFAFVYFETRIPGVPTSTFSVLTNFLVREISFVPSVTAEKWLNNITLWRCMGVEVQIHKFDSKWRWSNFRTRADLSQLTNYQFSKRLSDYQNQALGKRNILLPAGNLTPICRSSIPYPSRHTDWATPASKFICSVSKETRTAYFQVPWD